ncbi:MAG: hypothetical protein UU22_C0004G0001, partial [Parcubacteria group bacterium GW2011_GWA2_40_8]
IRYGLYVALAELFIGGFGYLFWIEIGGFRLSFRLALFSLLFLAGIIHIIRRRKITLSRWSGWPFYVAFIFVVIGGVVNGVLQGYSAKDVFLDMNGYLYYGLFFVFFEAVHSWETVTTNSTLAADTDGELNTSSWSPDSATKSDYYETGGSCGAACWTYFRLYQTSGAQTLKVDWVGQPLYLSSTYIISQTFDTNAVNGAGYHSIIWKGTKPAGTNVKIQLATSDCANGKTNPPACDSGGGWGSSSDYYADNGTTCAVTNYYTPAPGVSQKLNKCNTQFNNKRYFRYKVILDATPTRDAIPTVDDVSVNWTP